MRSQTKSILTILPIWKANPGADYSEAVDTPRVFEFLETVRSEEKVWTFAFENAQDIIKTLRLQLAFLFSESLSLQNRLCISGLPRFLDALGPRSLRIALEKADFWEYRLFFQSWIEKTESRADLIQEYRADLRLDAAEFVPVKKAVDWLETRLHELMGFASSIDHLGNREIPEAFGQPGVPGDAERIVWVTSMLDKAFERALTWARRIRCAHVESPFDRVTPELSLFVDDLVNEMIEFPRASLAKLEEAISVASVENPQMIRQEFVMTLSNTEKFYAALEDAKRVLQSGDR